MSCLLAGEVPIRFIRFSRFLLVFEQWKIMFHRLVFFAATTRRFLPLVKPMQVCLRHPMPCQQCCHFWGELYPGTHCTGGWVGPRAGLDRCRKSPLPPGFDPRTVQAVASRYTDWATGPTTVRMVLIFNWQKSAGQIKGKKKKSKARAIWSEYRK